MNRFANAFSWKTTASFKTPRVHLLARWRETLRYCTAVRRVYRGIPIVAVGCAFLYYDDDPDYGPEYIVERHAVAYVNMWEVRGRIAKCIVRRGRMLYDAYLGMFKFRRPYGARIELAYSEGYDIIDVGDIKGLLRAARELRIKLRDLIEKTYNVAVRELDRCFASTR